MDTSFLWVLLKKHPHLINQLLIAVLILIIGWHLGRITSPYYSSHAIIFNDRECGSCSSSGGSTDELVSFKEKGIAQRGETKGARTSKQVKKMNVEKWLFVGSRSSDKFHHKNCPTWNRIKSENRIYFTTKEEAQKAGYQPTKCTKKILGL